MAIDIEKLARRRAQTSFVSTIIGIALVLALLGMMSWILISAKDIARNVKENIYVDVNFVDGTKEADIIQFEKSLKAQPYVKTAHYVNKQEALERIKEMNFDKDSILNEEDVYNPIQPHIELFIKEEFANLNEVKKIEDKLMVENQGILESVTYDSNMFRDINKNINKLAIVLLAVSALLLVVAVALINNTIRLAIYSKRFLIRSMKLVGATEGFIRRPYLWRAVIQGVIAGIIALGILILSIYGLSNWLSDLNSIIQFNTLLILFGGITLGGILISWISTYFALRKYLRIKTDLLY
jgi:cell division transport system permease protein